MNESPALADWLSRIERLHPKTIDMTLERVREVAQRLNIRFDCPVITVGGTNGKGSTCTFLESILTQAGFRVALYTSPHLVRFNERARFAQEFVPDEALVAAFERIEAARTDATKGEVSLTYFEYTTLACFLWFMDCKPDAVVLEVGMGGRLDAVNLIDADVAIVTSVDLDHMEYLGPTREHIGWEKAHIYRAGRTAICGDPVPPQRLVDYAQEIGADLWLFGRDFNYSGDKNQWNWAGRGAALKDRIPVTQSAVRMGLLTAELPGRFQVLPGKPAIILDVAHNPHASGVLAANLDNMGFFPYTWAVFGSMADKDVAGVIEKLKGRIDHWLLTDLPTPRAASAAQLAEKLAAAGIVAGKDCRIETFADPASALAAAQAGASENDRIVVFGSFYTVGAALTALKRA